jgi:hypothetical protein
MSKTPGKVHQSSITRQFESSRYDSTNLAAAFECAVPTISRTVSSDRNPNVVVAEAPRVARAVS